jgi:hypothetical protein
LRARGWRGHARGTAHLFVCSACRAETRLAVSWKRLRPPRELESSVPVSEDFVRRVASAVAEDHRRRRRRRTVLSVAAGLILFFLAGAGREASQADPVRAEDSYSQLLAPPVLESLLPD